jgi:putative hydrolase of the HAD superfamily
MGIKAVIFDLFGTLLVPFDGKGWVETRIRMAARVNLDSELFDREWTGEMKRHRYGGTFPTIREEIRHICEKHGVSPSEEGLDEATRLRYEFTRASLVKRSDAVGTLKTLRELGLRIGMISDCSTEVPEMWHETPLYPLIDVPVFSCDTGFTKPDQRIYRHATEKLGVNPGRCVYVGDGFSNELTGARDFGMRPFLLLPPGEGHFESDSWEGSRWDGERITALSDIIEIVKRDYSVT